MTSSLTRRRDRPPELVHLERTSIAAGQANPGQSAAAARPVICDRTGGTVVITGPAAERHAILPGRWLSLAALLGLAALLVTGVASARRLDPRLSGVPGLDDHALHGACVTRIAHGEPYYAAVGTELRGRGYPSASVPNWRTPLHYRFVAALGTTLSKGLLLTAAVLAVFAAAVAFSRRSRAAGPAAAIVLFGTLLPILFTPGRASLFGEQWAGVLIALSLGAYHQRWFTAGALTGVLALFMRELAAPYAVVCGILALVRRRRTEAAVWIAGGVAYAIYYAMHVNAVLNAIQPGDYAWPQSWVRFLGWPFVLQTVWANGWTMVLPHAATPVLAVLGLSGTAARSMLPQLRFSLLTYVALFSVVGQEFNWYWGWVVAPLWGYALLYAPAGLRRLIGTVRGRYDKLSVNAE